MSISCLLCVMACKCVHLPPEAEGGTPSSAPGIQLANVRHRCFDGCMPEVLLNGDKVHARLVHQPGVGAAQIVRTKHNESPVNLNRVLLDEQLNTAWCESLGADTTSWVETTKNRPAADFCRIQPGLDKRQAPVEFSIRDQALFVAFAVPNQQCKLTAKLLPQILNDEIAQLVFSNAGAEHERKDSSVT